MAEISITKFQKREMTAIAFGHLEIGKLDIILGFGMVFENCIIEQGKASAVTKHFMEIK
jgi:hypothetical protein